MKRIIITFAFALLVQQTSQAQGATYVSNLGQTSTGSIAVGSDLWEASAFVTGGNASGYVLDSIQLGMTSGSGNPGGFTVMLYTMTGFQGPYPGTSLSTLNGSLNPVTGGTFTYTLSSSLTLSPVTSYFIVLTAGTTVANGAYDWSLTTNSFNLSDNWRAGSLLTSGNGSSWINNSGTPQFAITATDVPEPGVLSLFGLGGLAFLCHRAKSKAA